MENIENILIPNDLESQFNTKLYLDDQRERVFTNFIHEISEFLTKKEKLSLREISSKFAKEEFSHIQINLSLGKSQETDMEKFTQNLIKNAKNYKFVEKLTLENLKLDDKLVECIGVIIKNNSTKIKKLVIRNIEYEKQENIVSMYEIVNKLKSVNELNIGNVGNRDRLILHIIVNGKNLEFAKKIKTLKVDNIQTQQIPAILSIFNQVEDLAIENCSLDEELAVIKNAIKEFYGEDSILSLNLSSNGLVSPAAMEAFKSILKRQKNLEKLILKGLWFQNIADLDEEFKYLDKFKSIDLTAGKHIFNSIGSFIIFNNMRNIQSINLSDCRAEDKDFETLCKSLDENTGNTLQELTLFRNFLSSETITHLVNYHHLFRSLKLLNLSFNYKVTWKGVQALSDSIINKHLFPLITHLDLRNTGINLKKSTENIVELIYNRPKSFELLELYFCSFSEADYINFIKSVYNKSKCKEKFHGTPQNRMKVFLKLNRETNQKLFKKVEVYTEFIYKNENILIR